MKYGFALVGSVVALAACGGGGGSPSAPPGQPIVTASPVATSAPTTTPFPLAPVTIVLPSRPTAARSRAPRAADPDQTYFRSQILSVDGGPVPSTGVPPIWDNVLSTAPGGNCTTDPNSGITSCAVTVMAPKGTVAYQFDQSSNSIQTGFLSEAKPTLTQPSTGIPRVNMNSAVHYVDITVPTSLTYGTPYAGPVKLVPHDGYGALIVSGMYWKPVPLCDFDSSSHSWLVDTTDPAHPVQEKCVPLVSPSTPVSFTYDGAPIAPFAVATTITEPSPDTVWVYPEPPIVLAGTVPDDDAHGGKPADPNYRQDTLTFTMHPQLKSFTASQQGNPGPFKFTLDASCGTGASAIVAVTTTDNVTFNAAALNSGLCFGTVFGLQNSSHVVWFAVP